MLFLRVLAFLPTVLFVYFLFFSASAFADEIGVIGYPWSSSLSYTSADSYGEKSSLRLEQGLELGQRKTAWRLVPYVAVEYSSSNREKQYWNNATTPKSGLRLRRVFTSKTIRWGEATLGIERSQQRYHSEEAPDNESKTEVFVRVSMSGNWESN